MEDIYSDNNVYILGAGFSADAGLPLIKTFMNRLRDTYTGYDYIVKNKDCQDIDKANRILSALKEVIKFRLEASSVNYRINIDIENIENLFSLASISDDSKLEENIRLAICATISQKANKENSQFRINTIGKNNQLFPFEMGLSPAIENSPANDTSTTYNIDTYTYRLSQMLGDNWQDYKRNTFITLNYDTILEKSLASLSVPFVYGSDSQFIHSSAISTKYNSSIGVKVLKIHGSSNWREDPDNTDAVYVHDDFHSMQYYEDPDYLPLILPPTWNKTAKGYIKGVWKNSIEAIKNARRIIVIGYSFPATDNHIKYLIAEGLRSNVSLRSIDVWDLDPEKVIQQWGQLSIYSQDILRTTSLKGHTLLTNDIYKSIGRSIKYFDNVNLYPLPIN